MEDEIMVGILVHKYELVVSYFSEYSGHALGLVAVSRQERLVCSTGGKLAGGAPGQLSYPQKMDFHSPLEHK